MRHQCSTPCKTRFSYQHTAWNSPRCRAQRSHTQRPANASKTLVATTKPTSTPDQEQQQGGCQCAEPCSGQAQQEEAAGPSAVGLITAGAVVCSFISLQIKLLDHPLPPIEVTAVSSSVAWAATSVVLRVAGLSSSGSCQAGPGRLSLARLLRSSSSSSGSSSSGSSGRLFGLLLLRGLLAATAVTCYYSAIEELPLSVAVALFFFHPIFAVLLQAAVSRTLIPPAALASCCLSVAGVIILGWHDQLLQHLQDAAALVSGNGSSIVGSSSSAAAELPLAGVLFGLAGAAANAAAFVTIGAVGPSVSPWCLTYWQHLVVSHVSVGLVMLELLEDPFVTSTSSSLLQAGAVMLSDALPTRHDALLLLGVVAANFGGQVLLSAGLQRIDAGRGAALNTSQVLCGCVWDVALLGAAPSAAMLLGSAAIAAGVFGTAVFGGSSSSSRGGGGMASSRSA